MDIDATKHKQVSCMFMFQIFNLSYLHIYQTIDECWKHIRF